MTRTGLGVREAARHLHFSEGSALSAVAREKGMIKSRGRLGTYTYDPHATCGTEGCEICAPIVRKRDEAGRFVRRALVS